MSKVISFVNLEIEIVESDEAVVYRFAGDVNENFRQQDVPRIKKSQIIFELEGIENFNSCGIREWIYLVRDICKLGAVVFRHCSVTVVDQINMVPDSLGTGIIESFYAPYYCSDHGEISRLINVEKAAVELSNRNAPPFKCEKCDKELEFDALEESYFLFVDADLKSAS